MVIVLSIFAMIFVWGIKIRYIIYTTLLGLIIAPLTYFFYLKSYQKKRILSFLYPLSDPQASYNVDQAKKAIAIGGLTGNKTGEIIRVPVQESDFVFTAVAEWLGLIGATALIVFICIYLLRAVQISYKAVTYGEQYIGIGLVVMLGFQSIENIGMCMGLLPVTGIPLPFVSQGGSAMIVNYISIGILLCISANRRRWGGFIE